MDLQSYCLRKQQGEFVVVEQGNECHYYEYQLCKLQLKRNALLEVSISVLSPLREEKTFKNWFYFAVLIGYLDSVSYGRTSK